MTDPNSDAAKKARQRRNAALAGALIVFAVLVFVVTIVKMGVNAGAPLG